jgi:hypothetical protein
MAYREFFHKQYSGQEQVPQEDYYEEFGKV